MTAERNTADTSFNNWHVIGIPSTDKYNREKEYFKFRTDDISLLCSDSILPVLAVIIGHQQGRCHQLLTSARISDR